MRQSLRACACVGLNGFFDYSRFKYNKEGSIRKKYEGVHDFVVGKEFFHVKEKYRFK